MVDKREQNFGARHELEKKPCVFCDIHAGKAESSKISESEKAFAIMSLGGYPLVIPTAHVTVENLTEHLQDLAAASQLAFSLVDATKKALNASGISVITNLGKSAGQQVPHVHIHLINRNHHDRKVSFPPEPVIPRPELDLRARRIRSFIKTKPS